MDWYIKNVATEFQLLTGHFHNGDIANSSLSVELETAKVKSEV